MNRLINQYRNFSGCSRRNSEGLGHKIGPWDEGHGTLGKKAFHPEENERRQYRVSVRRVFDRLLNKKVMTSCYYKGRRIYFCQERLNLNVTCPLSERRDSRAYFPTIRGIYLEFSQCYAYLVNIMQSKIQVQFDLQTCLIIDYILLPKRLFQKYLTLYWCIYCQLYLKDK